MPSITRTHHRFAAATARGYIARVRRALTFRFIAVLMLGSVASTAPAVALAHGEAHHHEAEESVLPSPHAGISAPHSQADDHDHPLLKGVTQGRGDGVSPAFVDTASALPFALRPATRVPRVDAPGTPNVHPNTGPPPRPRAPPLS